MKKGYYIFNPFLDKKDYISASKLAMLINLPEDKLYSVIKNRTFINNFGYILPSNTPEGIYKFLESAKRWTKVTIPCECDYEVSNYGEIRKLKSDGTKGRKLKIHLNEAENRYYVMLLINDKRVNVFVDSLVAYHFSCKKDDPYDFIEYKDGNPANLYYKNLNSIPSKIQPDERWVEIKGTDGIYEVSDYGRVRKIINCRYRYFQLIPKGNSDTLCVHITIGGERKFHSVSRLVAKHFIKGFSNKLSVHFKDGDKTNLHYKNLELISKEDLGRKTAILARKLPLVICTDKNTGEVFGPFNSAREAAREMGVNRQSVSDNLNKKSKLVARKYIFEYKE